MEQTVATILKDSKELTFWLTALLPIIGANSLAQIWKLSFRDRKGYKPRGYMVAAVSTFLCMILSFLVFWGFGDEARLAMAKAVMWGASAPVTWMVLQFVAGKYFPGLAKAMKLDRRTPTQGPREVWTEDQRQEHNTMFGDSGDYTALRNEVQAAKKKEGGFALPSMYIYLVVGLVVVGLAAALFIRDQQYVAAKQEAAVKEVEARSYEARLSESTKRAETLNTALTTLANTNEEVRRLRGHLDRGFREAKVNDKETRDWAERPVPGTVAVSLRNRRQRQDSASASGGAGSSVSTVPSPDAGGGSQRGPVRPGS